MSVQERRVLVTGGSSGIGLGLVQGFLKSGAAVAFSYRSGDALSRPEVRKVMEDYPATVAIEADFLAGVDAAGLLDRAADGLGGAVDVLINNAAAFSRAEFLQTREEEFKTILQVNAVMPFLLIQAFSNALIRKAMPGSIINLKFERHARKRPMISVG